MNDAEQQTETSRLTSPKSKPSVTTDMQMEEKRGNMGGTKVGPCTTDSLTSTDVPLWRNSYPQVIGACLIHLLVIQAGINMAFSAILLPQLEKEDSDIQINSSQGSWIASVVTISLPIGSLLSGPLMDRFGRKKIGLLTCIPYILSWIIITWTDSFALLLIGRVVAGAASGLSNVAIVYTSETTHPLWRPMLLGANSVFVSLGILLTSVLGASFHWRTVAATFAVMNVAFFFLITFLPESPYWFLSFGNGVQNAQRVSRAEASVKWLNRSDSASDKVFREIFTACSLKEQTSPMSEETALQKLRNFKKTEVYRPLIILLYLFLFQQLSGSYVIVFYAIKLFEEMGGEFGLVNDYGAMICLGALRFFMAVVASILSRRFGRRTLCMTSGLGMGLSLLSAAIHIQFSENENKIFTLGCVLVFVCFSAVGWQIIPWTLTGELLPTRMRALAGGAIVSYTYIMMFFFVKSFPVVMDFLEIKGLFCLYGVAALASVGYVWKFLPETLGKTLAEIETFFK